MMAVVRCRVGLLSSPVRWCLRRALHLNSRCLAENKRNLPDKSTQITQPVAGSYHDPVEIIRKEMSGKGVNIEAPAETDVLIIGGGAMGLCVAYWLAKRCLGAMKITVVEKDPTYKKASTPLSVGGIRQQFSLPENVKMSLFGAEFIRDHKEYLSVKDMEPPEIPFTPGGYLLLASEEGEALMRENHILQRENGAHNKLFTPEELKTQLPWLNTQGLALGSLGMRNEGWFDPWTLLLALKVKAASLGVIFVKGELVDFTTKDDKGIRDGQVIKKDVLDYAHVRTDSEEVYPVKFAIVVNSAGFAAADVGKMAGIGVESSDNTILNIPIPVQPRKRYVFVVNCPCAPLLDMPLMVDPSGVWVRREGLAGQYLCGCSPEESEEPDASDLEVDHAWFEERVWPKLAERVPVFEALKDDSALDIPEDQVFQQHVQPWLANYIPAFKHAQVTSCYAGYYDYNFMDHNLIIGNHPYHRNFFMTVGSSGHGIQHAPAVGRAMAELILDDEFQTIDLSRFGFDRILTNELVFEENVI